MVYLGHNAPWRDAMARMVGLPMLQNVARTVDPEEQVPKELLQIALKTSGVSAARLSRKLVVDPGTISDWKRGEIALAPSRWMAVCAALKELNPEWTPPKWSPGDPPPKVGPRDDD